MEGERKGREEREGMSGFTLSRPGNPSKSNKLITVQCGNLNILTSKLTQAAVFPLVEFRSAHNICRTILAYYGDSNR